MGEALLREKPEKSESVNLHLRVPHAFKKIIHGQFLVGGLCVRLVLKFALTLVVVL